MLLLIVQGLVIGCLLRITGAGGGILTIPALMISQGWTVAQAAPVGLMAITISALIATFQGFIDKIVRYRAAIWIALISIPFAKYGVYLSGIVASNSLNLIFSIIMLMIAYRTLFKKTNVLENPPCKVNHDTGQLIWNIKTTFLLGMIGAIAGLLTGLFGVGGGFFIVPALQKMTDLKLHSIVATSLMIIFLIGAVSIAIHIFDGFRYPTGVTFNFILSCMTGMLIGRYLIHRISIRIVQNIFALTLMVISIYLAAPIFI